MSFELCTDLGELLNASFLSVAAREAKKQKHEILEDRSVYILTLQVYFANYLVLWFVVMRFNCFYLGGKRRCKL